MLGDATYPVRGATDRRQAPLAGWRESQVFRWDVPRQSHDNRWLGTQW